MDLTPSLLIAILESLLGSRIPFDDNAGMISPGDIKKVQDMKIFLGVLEHDILGMDVGLSDVDPRRLARGEWEDVVYVAEILCWIGTQLRESCQTPIEETMVMESQPIGLGIYESPVDPTPLEVTEYDNFYPSSPSLLSELDLNTNFTLGVLPSCSEDMDPTICAPLSRIGVQRVDKEYEWILKDTGS
ncbi:hypothetical protein F5887DRAFT_105365 [Amanita rubescens]|nr:hypothetical protein F5887DRAFT_105365 [Amanita rubescens]